MWLLPAAALLAGATNADVPGVLRVDPAAPSVPANILRLYVTFRAPARDRVRQRDVRLVDADGNPLALFMDFGQELWSPDGRRLTVLFDPGRVKRDVEGVGESLTPLTTGRRYTVFVGAFRHDYKATPPERQPLNPSAWTVRPPAAGSQAPLVLYFDRVMDPALLADQIGVANAAGKMTRGIGAVAKADRAWRFVPTRPWRVGAYQILIGAGLEDVSGNRIGEALDHLAKAPGAGPKGAMLRFTVAAAGKVARRRSSSDRHGMPLRRLAEQTDRSWAAYAYRTGAIPSLQRTKDEHG